MGRVISTALQFIDGFTRPSEQVIKSMKRMGREFQNAGKQIQNAGKTISGAGSALTKSITLPAAGVATAALKMSNDFENAMAKVSTIADTTATPMNVLKEQVISLSNAVGTGVSDIAEAQYQAISAGVDTASSVEFVSTAVKAAKGGFTDTATAVDGLTTVLNAYGLEAGRAADISDQMLMAQNFGKTSFGDMASSMGKVIPIAASLNVSTEDLFGSIAVLTKNGIATSEAVTGLKAAYSNILKPSADASKTAKQLGLDFSSAHLQSVGWAKFLDEIKDKTGGNAETMAKLFGSTEALNSVTVLAGKGAGDFAEALRLMGEAGGATQAAYEKMLTPAEKMNISINRVKNALIQFGAALAPVFTKAADIIGAVGDRLNSLSGAQVESIIKWAGVAAAVGPAVMIFGKVVTSVGKTVSAFGNITKTIANFGGIMGMVTSPAGIVIGVLAGVAAAAVLIIKNWEQIKGVLSGVGTWFREAFDKAGVSAAGFKETFLSIGNSVRTIGATIGNSIKSIMGVFKNEFGSEAGKAAAGMGTGMQAGVAVAIKAFDVLIKAVDGGMKVMGALAEFFAGAFRGNWDAAAQGFRDSLKGIFPEDIAVGLTNAFDKALPVIMGIVEGIKSAFGGMIQDTKKIMGSFKETFGGIGTLLKGIFTGDAETALAGFQKAAGSAIDAAGGIIRAKLNAIKNFTAGMLSAFLPQDIVNKIAGAFDVVASGWDAAIRIAKACVNGLSQIIRPAADSIKVILSGAAQFMKGVFAGDWASALDGIKAMADSALSGLVTAVKGAFGLVSNAVKDAVKAFMNMNIVKSALTSISNIVKNVLTKCGVDMGKFSANINNIKARAVSVINNLKVVFETVFGAIGKAVRVAAGVISGVFGGDINNTCQGAKTALSSFGNTAAAIFDFVVKAVQTAMAVIVPVVKVAFSVAGSVVSSAVHNMTSVISGLMTIFDGLIAFVSGVFTGNWSQAWEGVKTIFKGVFDSLAALCKAPLNAVISIINGAVSGINKLGITIPDWVPGLGGKAFSINIPTIPLLYKGTDNWQGGAAMIHDRGGEIVDLPKGSRVYPHDKSIEMARKEGAKTRGDITITIQKLADKIEVRNDKDIDRIAEALALKLKKVALNIGTV